MNNERFPIVCMALGDAYPDFYIARLFHMLQRQLERPFQLFCYSDRKRVVPADVELRDCSQWTDMTREGMRVTTHKIRLFDPATLPFEEFFYLDLTLVISKPLDPLLNASLERPEALVIVRDWFYPAYNSCIMRIRRGPLEPIYQGFIHGETYPQRIQGDQDFLTACLAAKRLQQEVATFPEGAVVSYKQARLINRTHPEQARQLMDNATIVKFHGKPKPHQILDPFYNFFRLRLKSRVDAHFWRNELRQNWELAA